MAQSEGMAASVRLAPTDQLLELVDRFERYRDAYRSGRYKGMRGRQELIELHCQRAVSQVDAKGQDG